MGTMQRRQATATMLRRVNALSQASAQRTNKLVLAGRSDRLRTMSTAGSVDACRSDGRDAAGSAVLEAASLPDSVAGQV